MLVSFAALAELYEVLSRKQFRRYVDEEEVRSFLAALTREAQWIDVEARIQACRDRASQKRHSRKFCAAHGGCHSPAGPRRSSSLWPCLSLVNEPRRCTRLQGSTVRTQISMAQGEKARGVVDSGFSGSPSFVAVMQSTDLR